MTPKHTFRLQMNTDTVDIAAKCIGISAWVPGDSLSLLNTNRGLHIQIRHNDDEKVFEVANDLARLIAAAPEMLEALKRGLSALAANGAPNCEAAKEMRAAIAKAEGRV